MSEEQKEKYANFLDKVSEILGLNKPVDILRLCAVIDEYLKPIEKRITELEKENTELRTKTTALENANRAMVKELDDMTSGGVSVLENVVRSKEQLTKAKEIIEELSKSLYLAKGIVRDLIDDTVDYKESKARAMYCYEQAKFDAYKVAVQFLKEVSE